MDVKEMEQLVKQIKSVISCKIILDDASNIDELHILADTRRGPKQISRDIQSSLISRFGYEIDHKKISIAQIDEKSVDESDFRLKLKTIEYSTSGTRADVKVILEKDDRFFQGQTSGANTTYNSQRLLAMATLKAVEEFLGIEDNFILEDIKITNLAGRETAIAAVTFIADHGEQIFSGCAFVNRDKKDAVVKSTLDAINRRVIKYYSES